MLRTLHVLLLVTILLAACSPSTPTPLPTAAPQTLGNTWTIKMHQSGGIMGLSRSIEISSDGIYTIRDERSTTAITGQLSSTQLKELRELAQSLADSSKPPKNPGVCADCFVYAIELRESSKTISVEVDDVSLEDSGLSPLVIFLRSRMEAVLK